MQSPDANAPAQTVAISMQSPAIINMPSPAAPDAHAPAQIWKLVIRVITMHLPKLKVGHQGNHDASAQIWKFVIRVITMHLPKVEVDHQGNHDAPAQI
jgi:hypothetical protein